MLAPAVAPAAALVPDASDTRTSAQALTGSFIAAIDRPGDHVWYSLRGSDTREPVGEIVDISVLRARPGCTAPQPLLLLLRTSEGRLIRTYTVSTKRTDVVVPSLPGHHYIEIRAVDSDCTLLYGLTIISQTVRRVHEVRAVTHGSQEALAQATQEAGQEFDFRVAALCRIIHSQIVGYVAQIQKLERRRRLLHSAAARRRYARAAKRERTKLTRRRARERNLACDQFQSAGVG
jgi:hypothetical protein